MGEENELTQEQLDEIYERAMAATSHWPDNESAHAAMFRDNSPKIDWCPNIGAADFVELCIRKEITDSPVRLVSKEEVKATPEQVYFLFKCGLSKWCVVRDDGLYLLVNVAGSIQHGIDIWSRSDELAKAAAKHYVKKGG